MASLSGSNFQRYRNSKSSSNKPSNYSSGNLNGAYDVSLLGDDHLSQNPGSCSHTADCVRQCANESINLMSGSVSNIKTDDSADLSASIRCSVDAVYKSVKAINAVANNDIIKIYSSAYLAAYTAAKTVPSDPCSQLCSC